MTSFDIIDLKEALQKDLEQVQAEIDSLEVIDTLAERLDDEVALDLEEVLDRLNAEAWECLKGLKEKEEALEKAIKAAEALRYNMEFLEGLK